MAKLTQEEILSYLEEATILELNDLVSAIEEKFGVVAAAAVAAAGAVDCRFTAVRFYARPLRSAAAEPVADVNRSGQRRSGPARHRLGYPPALCGDGDYRRSGAGTGRRRNADHPQ